MRLANVLRVIGKVLAIFSTAFLIPCAFAGLKGEEQAVKAFAVAFVLCGAIGYILSSINAKEKHFRRSEALGIVAGTWFIIAIAASVPYMYLGMAPVLALFEAFSGITTTGATIITDFSIYPDSFFLWRAMTQWFGGLGVIALFVVILPQLGVAGREILFAESSDATTDIVSPSVRESAQKLWLLYIALTVSQILMLYFVGNMNWFNSICHSLSGISAGGFSPNPDSIAGYNSPTIEWILIFYMILSGISFPLIWVGLTRRPLALIRDGEIKFYTLTLISCAIGISLILSEGIVNLSHFRSALFQSASLMTGTGFASVDYVGNESWNNATRGLLLIAMLIGGCAGSACGGPKAIRNLLSIKYIWSEITRTLHPRAVLSLRHRGKVIPVPVMRSILSLVLLYALTYCLVAIALMLLGSNFVTSFSAALACVANIGPGFGEVGPMSNYAHFDSASHIILSIGMWMGRLELVTVLALLHPDVITHIRWKSKTYRN